MIPRLLGKELIPFGGLLFFETESYNIAKAGLKPSILQPHSPECWDYRKVPPCLAHLRTFLRKERLMISGLLLSKTFPDSLLALPSGQSKVLPAPPGSQCPQSTMFSMATFMLSSQYKSGL
jgi:hypothetical protein